MTDREATNQAVTRVEHELGPVEILVNNAGISIVAPFLDISDTDWDRLMGVNLRGVLVVPQRVLPPMLSRRSGRIINISSMAGKEGLPNLAHYCATKFGVIGLTQALAKEVAGHHVTVIPSRRSPLQFTVEPDVHIGHPAMFRSILLELLSALGV